MATATRRRSTNVALSITGVVAGLVQAGCGEWEDQPANAETVCVDKETETVVEPAKCETAAADTSSGLVPLYAWYVLTAGQMAPKPGQPFNVSGGFKVVPPGPRPVVPLPANVAPVRPVAPPPPVRVAPPPAVGG